MTTEHKRELIAEIYLEHSGRVCGYISRHIGNDEDARDLSQDVFVRLLGYAAPITPSSVVNFIYSIAHNLIVDYLRRHAHKERAAEYFAIHNPHTTSTEYHEIEGILSRAVAGLSVQRARIYLMNDAGFSAGETAEALKLSRRTVENHLFAARKAVRAAVLAAIA